MAAIDHLLVHELKLRKYVTLKVPQDAIDDVMQQIWLKLLSAPESGKTFSYVVHQATWVIAHYYRQGLHRGSREECQSVNDPVLALSVESGEDTWVEMADLEMGLSRLSPDVREVVLCRGSGRTFREVAEKLGLRDRVASWRKHREGLRGLI